MCKVMENSYYTFMSLKNIMCCYVLVVEDVLLRLLVTPPVNARTTGTSMFFIGYVVNFVGLTCCIP